MDNIISETDAKAVDPRPGLLYLIGERQFLIKKMQAEVEALITQVYEMDAERAAPARASAQEPSPA